MRSPATASSGAGLGLASALSPNCTHGTVTLDTANQPGSSVLLRLPC